MKYLVLEAAYVIFCAIMVGCMANDERGQSAKVLLRVLAYSVVIIGIIAMVVTVYILSKAGVLTE